MPNARPILEQFRMTLTVRLDTVDLKGQVVAPEGESKLLACELFGRAYTGPDLAPL